MTTSSNPSRFLCWGLWAAGLAGLPLSHYWLLARVEPFYTPIYSFLWWSFILCVDLLVYLLRRNSLLHDRPREFFLLSVWSTPLWLVFEMLNQRLHNWYYVEAPYLFSTGMVFLAFAFATVLPGVFEVMELTVGLIERLAPGGRIAGRPFRVTRANVAIQIVFGVLMLALPLLWPDRFFCLIWGFAFLICDPICYLRKGRSLLGQLASGDNTRLVALLLSGVVTGFVWEFWNLWARTKWIYSVPFFDEIKIGEMPVLGFFGFPPFVLECYAVVNLVSLFRGGRNWELSAEENRSRRGMRRRTALLFAAVLVLFSVPASLVVATRSAASVSFPLKHEFGRLLKKRDIAALRRAGVTFPHQLVALKSPPPGVDPALFAQMRAVCELSELKGMGIPFARLLYRMGIRTPEQLAQCRPDDLVVRMKAASHGYLYPLEPWAKVWILEARRSMRKCGG